MTDDKDLKFKLGDVIQLQFVPDEGRGRLNTRIIGHAPGKSLIITAPTINGKMPLLRENQRFVIRMLQDSKVYGFESELLKFYSVPYPHVHLSHPQEVESIVVRGSRRVNTEMVVSIQDASGKTVKGSMLNTSSTGALLQAQSLLGELSDKVQISAEFNIDGIQKYLRLSAIIRNITTPEESGTSDTDYRHGVEFVDLTDDQKLVVHAYVYGQIVAQLDQ